MNNGLTSFDDILMGVQDETGINNLRNQAPQIRRLINRAETEINPFGTLLMKKKMVHYVGNGTFDGTSIKKPFDYVSIDEAGCCEDGICPEQYYETVSHIVLCDGMERDKIVWTYWAMQHDGNGNPIVSYNHREAVIAFIVWNLYKQRIWVNEGNANWAMQLKREWEDRCMESRGEDFMPETRQLDKVFQMNKWASLHFENITTYDRCLCCESCLVTEEEPETPEEEMRIYYWQLTNTSDNLAEVIASITSEAFFNDKEYRTPQIFEQGHIISYSSIGRICFGIKPSEIEEYTITDSLGNDVTDEFQKQYLPDYELILFVSNNYYSHSNIYFKFKKQ